MDTVGHLDEENVHDPLNNLEDQHLVPGKGDSVSVKQYGSFDTRSPEEAFHEALEVWGGPLQLLANAWLSLLPIILPLFLPSYHNMFHGGFLVRCRVIFPGLTFTRVLCEVTYPSVVFFPAIAIIISIGLVSWTFVQQRLFYVLLRRRVFLTFNCTGFIEGSLLILVVLLVLACIHWFLLISYGFTNKGLDGRNDRRIMGTSFFAIMQEPQLVFAKENEYLVQNIQRIITEYLFPAIWAILFTIWIGAVDDKSVPVSALVNAAPHYVSRHFAESILVSEQIGRDMIEREVPGGSGTSLKDLIADQDIDTACEIFRREALSYGGVSVMGSEAGVVSDPEWHFEKVALQPHEVFSMMLNTCTWWPLHIVLKDEVSQSMQFRRAWGIHCLLCAIIVVIVICIRSYSVCRRFAILMGLANGQGHMFYDPAGIGAQSCILCLVGIPIIAFYARILRTLCINIWEHLR